MVGGGHQVVILLTSMESLLVTFQAIESVLYEAIYLTQGVG